MSTITTHPSTGAPTEIPDSWPPYPHPILHSRLADALGRIGAILVVLGAIALASSVGGVALLAIGALCAVPSILGRVERANAHRQDLADAAALRRALADGRVIQSVEPTKLHADGGHLEEGEMCFIDGARAEALVFYGDPFIQKRGLVLFWGGPLAWIASVFGYIFMKDMNKRAEKKAAPRWRDPQPAQLWVTNRRLLVQELSNSRAWIELPFAEVAQMLSESDGIVLRLRTAPGKPLKLRLAHPAFHQTLLQGVMP